MQSEHELQHLPRRRPIKQWKLPWEKPYLDATDNFISRTTFKDIEGIVEKLGKAHGTRFEFECHDIGHLYNRAYCLDRKIVEPRNLLFAKETAERLFGDSYAWPVLAAERHQMAFTMMAGINGGNVRVGLKDSLYISWILFGHGGRRIECAGI